MVVLTDTSEPEDLTKSYKFTIHKCVHMQTCMRARTHACTHTHMHTHTHRTQLGIVQLSIFAIHCILVLGTLVIAEHANITKLPPHATYVALIPIHISTTLTFHSLPNQNSCMSCRTLVTFRSSTKIVHGKGKHNML